MRKTKNILLFSSTEDHLGRLEGPLRVAGYDLLIRHRIDEVLILCTVFKNTPRHIDLLIVGSSDGKKLQARRILQEKAVRAVLYAGCQVDSQEPYCINGNSGWLYKDSALLAAVRELLEGVEDCVGSMNC